MQNLKIKFQKVGEDMHLIVNGNDHVDLSTWNSGSEKHGVEAIFFHIDKEQVYDAFREAWEAK